MLKRVVMIEWSKRRAFFLNCHKMQKTSADFKTCHICRTSIFDGLGVLSLAARLMGLYVTLHPPLVLLLHPLAILLLQHLQVQEAVHVPA